MDTDKIKVFQVDDWAFVGAKTPEEAAAFIDAEPGRPDDPDDWELEEIEVSGNLAVLLQNHIKSGEGFPALIAIDPHYA